MEIKYLTFSELIEFIREKLTDVNNKSIKVLKVRNSSAENLYQTIEIMFNQVPSDKHYRLTVNYRMRLNPLTSTQLVIDKMLLDTDCCLQLKTIEDLIVFDMNDATLLNQENNEIKFTWEVMTVYGTELRQPNG